MFEEQLAYPLETNNRDAQKFIFTLLLTGGISIIIIFSRKHSESLGELKFIAF